MLANLGTDPSISALESLLKKGQTAASHPALIQVFPGPFLGTILNCEIRFTINRTAHNMSQNAEIFDFWKHAISKNCFICLYARRSSLNPGPLRFYQMWQKYTIGVRK
jgi:hypothetical protein